MTTSTLDYAIRDIAYLVSPDWQPTFESLGELDDWYLGLTDTAQIASPVVSKLIDEVI